jgi:formate hydrogenlyase subunit 6/NADH:ubiquinone oxidoreductase subunit I
MFKILQKTLRAGTVTQLYPETAARLASGFRGLPEFDWETWRDARPAADACPSGAIAVTDAGRSRTVTVDYGRCILCGECAAATPEGAVRVGRNFEAAATDRKALVISAQYTLDAEGRQTRLGAPPPRRSAANSPVGSTESWAVRSPSGRWTPDRATGANWKSWPSTTPSTTSNVSASTSSLPRATPTCFWSPAQ